MKVKVLFWGVLSEITGTGVKFYSDVKSIGHLKQLIADDFPQIVHYNFSISLNNTFIKGDSALCNGNEVALIPPFTGG